MAPPDIYFQLWAEINGRTGFGRGPRGPGARRHGSHGGHLYHCPASASWQCYTESQQLLYGTMTFNMNMNQDHYHNRSNGAFHCSPSALQSVCGYDMNNFLTLQF